MARMDNVKDSDFGRGRQNDSSSSRESSPQRPQKRSFTPTSDDGDLVIPPIADDDTPPPPERPLLRQPVAFSWDTSSSITQVSTSLNTYQATLPPAPTLNGAYFLPGQEVPIPPPVPKKKAANTKGKKTGSARRAKLTDEFSSQTSRFRLQVYDPTPTVDPPIHSGSGPYSSMYRGTSSEVGTLPFEAASPTPILSPTYGLNIGGDRSAIPSPVPESIAGPSNNQRPAAPPNRKSKQSNVKATPKVKGVASKTKGQNSAVKAKAKASIPANVSVLNNFTPVTHDPQANFRSPTPSGSSTGGATYYRHDYEGDKDHSYDPYARQSPSMLAPDRRSLTSLPQSRQAPAPGGSFNPVERDGSNIPAPSQNERGGASTTEPGVRRMVRQIRMVTVLIQDVRSGTTDHQLAEVKIPLRTADDPQDGYWADAKELSEKLQASPSRIDGPAKVYTLRGKYRQFFLRVSSENVDDCISANLIVSPDRTLDVVVETMLPPGTIPLPPRIPRDLLSPTPEAESPSSSHNLSYTDPRRVYTEDRQSTDHDHKKRRMSPSFDDYDYESDHDSQRRQQGSVSTLSSTHNGASYGSPTGTVRSLDHLAVDTRPAKRSRGKEDHMTADDLRKAALARYSSTEQRGYESPTSDEEPDSLRELISKAVDSSLQKDPEWKDYFKSKGAPQRVQEVLKQYRFVQRMMDTWVGQRAAFRTCDYTIEKVHIIRALRIDDQKFSSDCTETLRLLGLYGTDGERFEDPRVVEMVNDQSLPEYNAKPIKRLLRLLREIDVDWVKEHPESAMYISTSNRGLPQEMGEGPRNPS